MAEHRTLTDAPLLLAVESATEQASVALLRGSEVLGREVGRPGQHHAETLLPMVDAVLAEARTSAAEVEAFGVLIGPGGFTSLRIGLATIKGLAFGSDRPVAPVSTLRALAFEAWRNGAVPGAANCLPALDARRGEVYLGAYALRSAGGDAGAGPDIETILDAGVHPPRTIASIAGRGCLVGEGARIVARDLESIVPGRYTLGPAIRPDAVSVGLLAIAQIGAGQGVAAADLVPRYVRRAEAEAQRTAERFE